jgi:hypothetical protein
METQGFYKYQDEQLFCAAHIVEGQGILLMCEQKDQYEYSIDGWHWFDSEEEAVEYFGISIEKTNTEDLQNNE